MYQKQWKKLGLKIFNLKQKIYYLVNISYIHSKLEIEKTSTSNTSSKKRKTEDEPNEIEGKKEKSEK